MKYKQLENIIFIKNVDDFLISFHSVITKEVAVQAAHRTFLIVPSSNVDHNVRQYIKSKESIR